MEKTTLAVRRARQFPDAFRGPVDPVHGTFGAFPLRASVSHRQTDWSMP